MKKKQLLAVILCFLYYYNPADSFFLQSPPTQLLRVVKTSTYNKSSSSSLLCSLRSSEGFVEAAVQKLVWERLEDQQNRPVLNLSERDASVTDEDSSSSSASSEDEDTSAWDEGQRWRETEQQLMQLLLDGCSEDDDNNDDNNSIGFLLDTSPQLYRLKTAQIVETATWMSQEFGTAYVFEEPRLLTYRRSDVEYGLTFIGIMMMLQNHPEKVKAACQSAPPLLLSAVDGGIQERSVSKALGEASNATYQTNQRIAGDAVATLKTIKNKSSKK